MPRDTPWAESDVHKRPQELLKWFEELLTKDDSTAQLFCDALGLESRKDNQCLFVKLNGRAVSETDIEHFLCKIYVGACKTISSRATSQFPVSGKSGYHPIKTDTSLGQLWDNGPLAAILEKCIEAYTCLRRNGIITQTPECFLFNNELDPVPISNEE